jgi:hypothetical protein
MGDGVGEGRRIGVENNVSAADVKDMRGAWPPMLYLFRGNEVHWQDEEGGRMSRTHQEMCSCSKQLTQDQGIQPFPWRHSRHQHTPRTPRTPQARATGAHLEAMRVSRREGWEEVAAALPATEAAEAAVKATASLGVTWPVAGAGARMGARAGAGVGAGGTTRA